MARLLIPSEDRGLDHGHERLKAVATVAAVRFSYVEAPDRSDRLICYPTLTLIDDLPDYVINNMASCYVYCGDTRTLRHVPQQNVGANWRRCEIILKLEDSEDLEYTVPDRERSYTTFDVSSLRIYRGVNELSEDIRRCLCGLPCGEEFTFPLSALSSLCGLPDNDRSYDKIRGFDGTFKRHTGRFIQTLFDGRGYDPLPEQPSHGKTRLIEIEETKAQPRLPSSLFYEIDMSTGTREGDARDYPRPLIIGLTRDGRNLRTYRSLLPAGGSRWFSSGGRDVGGCRFIPGACTLPGDFVAVWGTEDGFHMVFVRTIGVLPSMVSVVQPMAYCAPVFVPRREVDSKPRRFRLLPLSLQEAIDTVPGLGHALVKGLNAYQGILLQAEKKGTPLDERCAFDASYVKTMPKDHVVYAYAPTSGYTLWNMGHHQYGSLKSLFYVIQSAALNRGGNTLKDQAPEPRSWEAVQPVAPKLALIL